MRQYISLKEFLANISLYVRLSEGGRFQLLPLRNCTHGPKILPLLLVFMELPVWKESSALPSHFAEHYRRPENLTPTRWTSIFERVHNLQYPNMMTNWCYALTGKFIP